MSCIVHERQQFFECWSSMGIIFQAFRDHVFQVVAPHFGWMFDLQRVIVFWINDPQRLRRQTAVVYQAPLDTDSNRDMKSGNIFLDGAGAFPYPDYPRPVVGEYLERHAIPWEEL